MLNLIRILLGPILLMQGKRVRRDILRLPEPDGAREGETGNGAELSVLLLGDSATAGVGVATQAQALSGQLSTRLARIYRLRWRLVAKTGWTTADGLAALGDLAPKHYDVTLISLGVNDVTTEERLEDWLACYAQIATRLQSTHGCKLVLACALPPMGGFTALPQPLRWYLGQHALRFDAALAGWAAAQGGVHQLTFDKSLNPSDMAEDGFHPGPVIYDAWAAKAAAVIQQAMPPPREEAPSPLQDTLS